MEKANAFLDRYRTHIQLPGFGVPGQQTFAVAKALVIGAGALASPVISYLASMGIGTLGIMSDEIIRQEDLPAQPLYFSSDAGKLKGQVAVKQIREINPDVKVAWIEDAPHSNNIVQIISGYDLVIDCANNGEQSYLIGDACVLAGVPMVYGALFHPSGYVATFNYNNSGTYRCMMANAEIAHLYRQKPTPGLSVLPAITGSLMANEAAKIISKMGNVAYNKLLLYNSFTNQLETKTFTPVAENKLVSLPGKIHQDSVAAKQSSSSMRAISPKLLQTKIKYNETLQLIDIRNSINESRLSWNFLHIPEKQLLERSDEIHQDIIVVLISEDGESAKRFCAVLNEKAGFDNIQYLEGGMEAWEKETASAQIKYESM